MNIVRNVLVQHLVRLASLAMSSIRINALTNVLQAFTIIVGHALVNICYQEDLIFFKLVHQKHRVVQSASQQRDLVLHVHQLGITMARRALPHAQTEIMLIVI